MEIKSVEIIDVEALSIDKFRSCTKEGEVFFSKGVKPEIGHAKVEYFENAKGKKVIGTFMPCAEEIGEVKEMIHISQKKEEGKGFYSYNSPLLEAIWQSPALGTQPGNPDEILKIAKQWYEESLKWIK